MWSTELSDLTAALGEQTEYDKTHNIEKTLGYIFFAEKISCIPLRELIRSRPEWEGIVIDKAALMNAIWDVAPEYATLMNCQEQSGKNDLFAALLAEVGVTIQPNVSMDNMIQIVQGAGSDFLLLRKCISICTNRAE